MTIKMLAVAAVVCVVSACGGSPTAPAPVPSVPIVVQSTTPAPEPPAVVPDEPPPPPAPAPPAQAKKWKADTDTAHWYGRHLLSRRFTVSWKGSALTFGQVRATIALQDDRSLFATGPDGSIQIVFSSSTRGSWTFNGLAGQAAGTLKFE